MEGPIHHAISEYEGVRLSSMRSWEGRIDDSVEFYVAPQIEEDAHSIRLSAWKYDDGKPQRVLTHVRLHDTDAVVWKQYVAPDDDYFTMSNKTRRRSPPPLCVHCKASLLLYKAPAIRRTTPLLPVSIEEQFLLCDTCGWWIASSGFSIANDGQQWGFGFRGLTRSFGTLRRYAISNADIPIASLRRWLQQHPHHVSHVDPGAFERLIAACFRDVYHDVDVIHVGKSHDHGIDIVLVRNDIVETLVQVKRRRDLGSSRRCGSGA